MNPSNLSAALAAKHQSKLSDAELFTLCMLVSNGPLRPRIIVNTLGITPGGVNSATKKLIARKLVTKRRDDHGDERSVRYHITQNGRRAVELITQARELKIA